MNISLWIIYHLIKKIQTIGEENSSLNGMDFEKVDGPATDVDNIIIFSCMKESKDFYYEALSKDYG